MKRILPHLNKIFRLLRHVPSYRMLLVLQVLSSVTSFIGLPMLVPVINFISKGSLGEGTGAIMGLFQKFLTALHLPMTLPVMLIAVTILTVSAIFLNGVVLLMASFGQYRLFSDGAKRLIRGYMHVRWPWVTQTNTGLINHALYSEASNRASACFSALKLATTFIELLGYVFITIYISWKVAIIGCFVLSLILMVNLFAARKVKNASMKKNQMQKNFAELVQSIQQNKKFLKSSVFQPMLIARVDTVVHRMESLARSMVMWDQSQPLWTQLAIFLVFVLMIAKHSLLGVGLEELFVLLLVIMRLLPLVKNFSSTYSTLCRFMPVADSLEERFREMDDNREVFGKAAYKDGSEIVMEGIDFSYDGQRDIFKKADLEIRPNTTVAIVGGSGEGKSTIFDLLLGLWMPKSGTIRYGDVPHHDLDYHSLRKRVAYVSQETTLFAGTLRENLDIGEKNFSERKIMDVLQAVQLGSLLEKLPQGLDTIIGENGIFLSGGQRQRVALARALLLDPDILILDEATSALDIATEEDILKAVFQRLQHTMTILISTHRLSTVAKADVIYRIENQSLVKVRNEELLS